VPLETSIIWFSGKVNPAISKNFERYIQKIEIKSKVKIIEKRLQFLIVK